MALIKRRTAVLVIYMTFFVSLSLSVLYLYNFVVDFYTRMDAKLGNLNQFILQLQGMEKELTELESFKQKVAESPRLDINQELRATELSNLIMKILQTEIVELNYLMISCETPEPIVFEEKECTYKVILKTGGSVGGIEGQ